MVRQRLPEVRLVRAIRIAYEVPDRPSMGGLQTLVSWQVIGFVGDCPFLLCRNRRTGPPGWWCERHLGQPLCRKILNQFKRELRDAPELPDYAVSHNLAGMPRDQQVGIHLRLDREFFNDVWRREYLGIDEEKWVDLNVPFAEKDQAKALGARWDAQRRVWKAPMADDMSAFERWLRTGPDEGSET